MTIVFVIQQNKHKGDQKGIVWKRNCHVEGKCCYGMGQNNMK